MNTTRNWIIGSLMAVTLGSSLALAWGPGCEGGPGAGREGMEHKMSQRMEQHQKALHDALKLTPDQESAWAAYAGKMKGPDIKGMQSNREEMSKLSTPERLDRMNELARQHLKSMEERSAATKSFYAGLNPEQKKAFDEYHNHGGKGRGPGVPRGEGGK